MRFFKSFICRIFVILSLCSLTCAWDEYREQFGRSFENVLKISAHDLMVKTLNAATGFYEAVLQDFSEGSEEHTRLKAYLATLYEISNELKEAEFSSEKLVAVIKKYEEKRKLPSDIFGLDPSTAALPTNIQTSLTKHDIQQFRNRIRKAIQSFATDISSKWDILYAGIPLSVLQKYPKYMTINSLMKQLPDSKLKMRKFDEIMELMCTFFNFQDWNRIIDGN